MTKSSCPVALLGVLFVLNGCPSEDDDTTDDDTSQSDDDDVSDDDTTGDDDDNTGDDDSTASDDDSSDDDDTTGTGPPIPSALTGWARAIESVGMDGEPFDADVIVELWGGPQPTAQTVVMTDGECKLLRGHYDEPDLCDPPCTPGTQACIEGTCIDYPGLAPSGAVTIEGLVQPVTLEPDGTGRYPGASGLPDDIFDSGDQVHVSSTGGVTGPLDLVAEGVPGLVTTYLEFIQPGQEYTIRWEPAEDPTHTIRLLLETGWHGSPDLTTIWCETEDDGELVVPASITAEFEPADCGECPTMSSLVRISRDVVDLGGGPIELLVASRLSFLPWM